MVAWLGRQRYKPTIFVDSGGFSAFTQGVVVNLREYAGWIRRNKSAFAHYANLDAIGDARATLANQLRMEQMGLRPLPITHYGTDPSELAVYAAHGYSYQCLGGMVPHLRDVAATLASGERHPLLDWLDRCFEVAAEHGVGLHGFGATTWPLVCKYGWRSVDSSSWAAGYRYGDFAIFDYRRGVWQNVRVGDRTAIMRLSSLLREYGADPLSLVRDDKFSRHNIIHASAKSWLVAQRWLAAHRKQEMQVFLADASGRDAVAAGQAVTKVYLVDTDLRHLEAARDALNKE